MLFFGKNSWRKPDLIGEGTDPELFTRSWCKLWFIMALKTGSRITSSDLPTLESKLAHGKTLLCRRKSCSFAMASWPLWSTELKLDIFYSFTYWNVKPSKPETLLPRFSSSSSSFSSSPSPPFSWSLWLDNWSILDKVILNACWTVSVILWRYTGKILYEYSMCRMAKESLGKEYNTKRQSSLYTVNILPQGLWIDLDEQERPVGDHPKSPCEWPVLAFTWPSLSPLKTRVRHEQAILLGQMSTPKLVFGDSQLLDLSFIPGSFLSSIWIFIFLFSENTWNLSLTPPLCVVSKA